tara:strand:- start:6560 stop:7306 length:747 start_codon:yes stop_codon:yes gene_type:complete
MSRLRKNGKTKSKYKGGFSTQFSSGLSMRTPFHKVAVAGSENALEESSIAEDPDVIKTEEPKESGDPGAAEQRSNTLKESGASEAAVNNAGDKDTVPSDTDYSREEVGAFFQRVKMAKEKEALDKQKAEAEEANKIKEDEIDKGQLKEEEENEELRESTSQGEDIGYDAESNKKDARGEIKESKKVAKDTARQEKKDKKKAARKNPDGTKRTKQDKKAMKRDAKKDFKDDKKQIRKNKRQSKKDNRKR